MTPSDMPALFSRRAFGRLLAGAAVLSLPAVPARALTTAEARDLVSRMVADIQRVINSGRAEAAMLRDFEQIMARYGDMPIIAQTVLGPDWRRASNRQRRAFVEAFQGYMARKYGRRFREFIGGEIEVESARQVRNVYEVVTRVRLRGQSPFEVVFLVSDGSGQDRFFNMIIEGINLRTTERTEIGALLDRNGGDIDAMIDDLRRAG